MSTTKPRTLKEYIDDTVERAKVSFKDHVATLVRYGVENPKDPAVVHYLRWRRKNGSSIYSMTAIINVGTLMVHGDLYEATYQWSDHITFEWVAGCDLGYFESKQRAVSVSCLSRHGWDDGVALHRLNAMLADESAKEEGDIEDGSLIDCIKNAIAAGGDKLECARIANDFYNDSGDCETAGSISGCGDVPHSETITHHVGIKMAVEWLKNNASN